MSLDRVVLCAVLLAFAIYLVVQVRPRRRRRARLGPGIIAAREAAQLADSPQTRARALAEAGEAAVRARRWVAAAGLFSRALRSDPTSVELVERAAHALDRHPRAAGRLLGRHLATLADEPSGAHRARAVTAIALARLYEGPLRDRHYARSMRRLAALETAELERATDPLTTTSG